MNKVIVFMLGVLVLPACSDRLEHKNQEAIELLQVEVMTLKNQVAVIQQKNFISANSLASINIGPLSYKSELDARLASVTLRRGLESFELTLSESGGTELTLFLWDGRPFKTIHVAQSFISELTPYNGLVRDRITFLISAEPDNEQATLLKQIILSILEDREHV